MTAASPRNPRFEPDEIDLAQLIRFLWAGRWRICALAAAATLLVVSAYAVDYLSPTGKRSYSVVVQFTFPGADSARYPNKQPFNVTDVVSSDVLGSVYESVGIEQYGVTQAEFAAAVAIRPYAISEDFIAQRYKEKLDQKGLTQAEIEATENAYKQDLQQNARRFAKLSLVLERNSAVPPALVDHILQEIPRAWSEISIRRRGVLDVVSLSGAGMEIHNLTDAEYALALERLKEYLEAMEQGIARMLSDEQLKTLREPNSGWLPADLEVRAEEFRRYQLAPLQVEILERGYVRDRALAELYFRSKRQDLENARAEMLRKAEVYSSTIKGLGEQANRTRAGEVSGAAGQAVDVAYFDRVLELGSRLSESEFRHSLARLQVEQRVAAEELTTEILELDRQLVLLDTATATGMGASENLNARLSGLFHEFEVLRRVYDGLATAARNVLLGNAGQLYRPLSTAVEVADPQQENVRRLLLLLFVALFLGAVLGVALHLIVAVRPAGPMPYTTFQRSEVTGGPQTDARTADKSSK